MAKHQLFKLLRILVVIEQCGKYLEGKEVVVHIQKLTKSPPVRKKNHI